MSAPPVYKLEKDLCRCCHAEGSFFNLSDTVYNSGQVEVYSDMLQTTLDLEIMPMDGDVNMMTFTICGQCVLRLRDAHNFKQQVIECEQRFKLMYSNMVLADRKTVNIVQIKEEVDAEVAEKFEEDIKNGVNENSGDDFHWKSDHSEEEPEVKIKFVSKSKPKPRSKQKQSPTKPASSEPVAETSKTSENPEDPENPETPWWHRDAKPPKGRRLLHKQPIRDTDYRIEGGSYICCHCENVYRSKDSVKSHIKYVHFNVRRRHCCPYCDLSFKYETPLTLHKLQAHNVDERTKCNACDAIYNSKERLVRHMQCFHQLGEKFKCDICTYETYDKRLFSIHIKYHKAERNFRCAHCGKSFKRKTNLRLHEKIHTNDKTKVCKECNKSFVQKASLNYHMTKYHPEVKF